MGRFVKGDVVVLPFPFSDLTATKRRPALVVAAAGGPDLILCQITSKQKSDRDAVLITKGDFKQGSLKQESAARPNRLFTGDSAIVLYRVGCLKLAKLREVIDKIIELIQR